MSKLLRLMSLTAASLTSLAGTGCICVIGASCGLGCSRTVWTEQKSEELAIDASGLNGLEVRTHNGKVAYTAETGAGQVLVKVQKRTGGRTADDAEDAMAALDVFVEDGSGGKKKLGYRWTQTKRSSWQAKVEFVMDGPDKVALDIETHNGPIEVSGVAADVKAVTHNGPIVARSGEGSLSARTHNGGIEAKYAGPNIALATHNGKIEADLTGCGSIRGEIETHNGGVELVFGAATSTRIKCDTHNGGINMDAPITASTVTRRFVEGTIGYGGEPLIISTHNGGIRVTKSAG